MNGCQNRFVVCDHDTLDADASAIAKLCAAHCVDGYIVAERYPHLRMRYWNSDGSVGAMCGNGLRCTVRYALSQGWIERGDGFVLTDVGKHRYLVDDDNVAVEMHVPTLADDDDGRLNALRFDALDVLDRRFERTLRVNVGNQHCVVLLSGDVELERFDVPKFGAAIQALDGYEQANVEFVRFAPPLVEQRTFERGSGETLACGSGACAVFVAHLVHSGGAALPLADAAPLTIRMRGGDVVISPLTASSLLLRGRAEFE
jgi:diaminopimelate epimerase